MTREHTHRISRQLMLGFHESAGQPPESRWAWLMAAHIVGQQDFGLHWRSHGTMLRFAWRTRDYREAAGQLLRLGLVPLGHLAGRLPAGNPGRATVKAFTPMPVSPPLQALISRARERAAQQR